MTRTKRAATAPGKVEGRLRCAIYTRKSSDEGLEQSFNSLHAQREACEAYVLSQVGEGWTALPTLYDDGGFSGGNMQRPALTRLLCDVEAGLIDVVVVYKVDRLTRALADFAKIVERFDAAGVSFVSVTQAFNTTSSMGRLTLNVLLSFAQFEREVTGERIRDKIALSKAKGMWMGGVPPLGYVAKDRALVVDEAAAEQVRAIFRRYLALGSVHKLRAMLEAEGVRSKRWVRQDGQAIGGAVIGRGALFHILQNRLYRGEIVHKGEAHPGLHLPIVDAELFDAVQARLKDHRIRHRARVTKAAEALLTGRLFDAAGAPMSPTFACGRSGRSYGYYVSTSLQCGRKSSEEARDLISRVSVTALERTMTEQLRRLTGRPELQTSELSAMVRRVELRSADTQLVLDADAIFGGDHPELALESLQRRMHLDERAVWEAGRARAVRVVLPIRMQLRGGRTSFVGPNGDIVASASTPRVDEALLKLLRSAHRHQEEQDASPTIPARELTDPRPGLASYHRNLGRLAFLAPDLQQALVEGKLPTSVTAQRLMSGELPLAWADQRRWVESATAS